MAVKFKTVITKAGAEKLAAATVPNGKKVNFTTMAVGDGGGALPTPDPNQTKLINEVWRHALNKISQDKKNKNYVVAELLIPPETGGFWMRELGLYDDAGTLIAVGNMAESYKPALAEGSGRAQTVRMVIMVSDIESVELTIDSSTVMATQDYVDDKIAEHEQSRRHPDATLTAKGFTQLSSATDSVSESLAATPKAVKAAYDLAKGKYTAQDATTAQKGIVQLSSATDSTSESLAATPKAVKAAYDLAKGKYTAQDATTAQKGIVQLSSATDSTSESLAATPKAVKAAYDLAKGKYTAQDATTAQKGIVQLSSATDSTSEALAATPKAVKAANDNANGRVPLTGGTVTGNLSVNGQIAVGDSRKLAVYSLNTSSLAGAVTLWGNVDRPTVLEFKDANGYHFYSQRNVNGSVSFSFNGAANFVGELSAYYYKATQRPGAGAFASQYTSLAPFYHEFSSASASEYNPLWKQKHTAGHMWSGGMLVNAESFVIQYIGSNGTNVIFNFAKDGQFSPGNWANFDARYQAKGSYTPAGQAYTKAESDARFQPKGNYTPTGTAYTKAESDSKYQLKGNYALVGASYTKAESDARYGVINGIRRGGQQIRNPTDAWFGNWESPAGCVVTGIQMDGRSDGRKLGVYFRQMQYLNKQTGAWVNIGD
ncbi:tail fiber protein [Enterobacter hormaechei]|uniref:tail fiber protein n=1 Tax=Enterobacter hormaechei TaxID=158836 RepID=UPI0020755E22|nr:tail fiber protein [Enterobacter hormaechei]MCM7542910.1 tail fiber protein [Enterobacter hormaechei]MCM7584605.1 tail fiber protein [Enterobacter hormaechei]MDX7045319.1 tail fiber protein [Enterobacter hormaechei]